MHSPHATTYTGLFKVDISDQFRIAAPREEVYRAVRRALVEPEWKIAALDEPRSILLAPTEKTIAQWPSQLAVALSEDDAHTIVFIQGQVGRAGPIQRRFLERRIAQLRSAIGQQEQ
jgi:hypothetical protein